MRWIFGFVAFFGFGCLGFGAEGAWSVEVLKLFSLEKRDEALRHILLDGRYVENPAYKEEAMLENGPKRIRSVMVCPQRGGLPLVAVCYGSLVSVDGVPRMEPGDHLILVRADGVIVPVWGGDNLLGGSFVDLNGDGVIERVDSWSKQWVEGKRLVTELYVVAVTEGLEVSLRVSWLKGDFVWRLASKNGSSWPVVEIGRMVDGDFVVVGSYGWSNEKRGFVGPDGSVEEGFLRVKVGDGGREGKVLIEG